jgi:hypothetical protein
MRVIISINRQNKKEKPENDILTAGKLWLAGEEYAIVI